MFRQRVRDRDLVRGVGVAGDDQHRVAERPGVEVEDGREVVGPADVVRVAVRVDVRGQGADDGGEDGEVAEEGVVWGHWLGCQRWGCEVEGGGEIAYETLHQPSLLVEFEAEGDEQAGEKHEHG